ncbi:MAG TPA: helix-turn-helix transcriptional regulator [Clostridia bacterium]|nr:helix-turn-helix transcriptional regulator [Clostridia bacterium]
MSELRTYLPIHRAEKGMTQEELAALVNVRRETISRLEKGLYNPSLKLAMDIAKVFGLPVEKLFEFNNGE